MSKYYAKPTYGYDANPVILVPPAADITAIKTAILAFINTGKKNYTEIQEEILVSQAYASSKGATGNDIKKILDDLVSESSLNESGRGDGLFLEPVIEV